MSEKQPPAQYPEPTVRELDRAGLRDLIDSGSKEAKDELDRRNA